MNGRRRCGCWRAAALVVGVLALMPTPLRAQAVDFESFGDEEVRIDAESLIYDQAADRISASGDVVIERGGTVLRADEVHFDRRTNQAAALGHVSLSDVEGTLFAEQMQLNLDDETGALLAAQVYSKRLGYSLQGDRIEKREGHSYHIENGVFTTCRCADGPPSWSIAGKVFDVELDGDGVLEGAEFRVLNVPIMYLPRLSFPVSRERRSGLLIPRLGVSNRRGFQIVQPFYWPINKSQDLTFGFDLETSARIGLIAEYRYALWRDFIGSWSMSYFNEAIRSTSSDSTTGEPFDVDVPENRWGVIGDHTQRIGSFEAYVDALVVGDDLFLRDMNTYTIDYATDVALRTLPFTVSRVGVLGPWDRVTLQAEARAYQDLIGPQAVTLQRLPEARVTSQKLLPFGVQGQLVSSAVNFTRQDGFAGFRFDVEPGLEVPLPLGRSLFGAVSATFRETAYQLTDTENLLACESDIDCGIGEACINGFCSITPDDPFNDIPAELPRSSSRETVVLRGNLHTDLSRIFAFPHFGFDKLKHTIEPALNYLYVPSVMQDDLPLFDGLDRIDQRNLITYGVASRLLARTPPTDGVAQSRGHVFELARLLIAQSYDFDRVIEPVGGVGNADHFSDIDFNFRVNPTRSTSLRLLSSYDVSNSDISGVTVGVRLQEPLELDGPDADRLRFRTRHSLSVDYRFITDNILQNLESSLVIRLTDQIGTMYAMRYDVADNRFLENYAGLRFVSECDCWSLDLGVVDTANPNEVRVQAQISLLGLGADASGFLPGS